MPVPSCTISFHLSNTSYHNQFIISCQYPAAQSHSISLTPAITVSSLSHAIYQLHNLIAGSTRSPHNLSSRMVFLFLLMLSLFLTTSYSAIIVSLLQMSSTAVNTLTELMDSPFKLSMEDASYNKNLVNVRGQKNYSNCENITQPLDVSHLTAHSYWMYLT